MGIAALVLGIVSLVIAWIPLCGYAAFIPAVVGLILGIVDTIKKSKKGEKKGISIAGIILNAIALIIITVYTVIIGNAANKVLTEYNSIDWNDVEWNVTFNDIDWNEVFTTDAE